uniref:4Fe-4S ferredoxin-type domain-containing protein n=1 Tax=Knipowitschia caucasica TaxID=637954 RepID=A0AAV2LB95_KNICA
MCFVVLEKALTVFPGCPLGAFSGSTGVGTVSVRASSCMTGGPELVRIGQVGGGSGSETQDFISVFADNVVLLAPTNQDLQLHWGGWHRVCEAAGMRISTQIEAMVPTGKSEGRMEREIDRRDPVSACAVGCGRCIGPLCPNGRRPRGRPRTRWKGLCLSAGLGTPWGPPDELEEVCVDGMLGRLCLGLPPPRLGNG